MTEPEAREIVEKYEALIRAAQHSAGAYEYGFAQAHICFTDRGLELWECDEAGRGECGIEVTAHILNVDFLSAV